MKKYDMKNCDMCKGAMAVLAGIFALAVAYTLGWKAGRSTADADTFDDEFDDEMSDAEIEKDFDSSDTKEVN